MVPTNDPDWLSVVMVSMEHVAVGSHPHLYGSVNMLYMLNAHRRRVFNMFTVCYLDTKYS